MKKDKFEKYQKTTLGHHILDYVYAKADTGLADNTIRNIEVCLRHWRDYLDKTGKQVSAQTMEDYIKYCTKKSKTLASVKLRVSLVCSFYKWMANESRIMRNPFLGWRWRKKISPQAKRGYTADELSTIKANCPTVTERCWIGLHLSAGLRTSEVANLTVKQIDFENETIRIDNKGSVHTIGVHLRLDPQLFVDLKEHMRREGVTKGRLFPIDEKKYYTQAKELLPRGTPHLLRNTAGVLIYLKSGRCMKTTQRFMRHTSMQTTSQYLDSMIIDRENQIESTVW